QPLTGHAGPVTAVAVGRLGDRDVIVSGSEDATVRLWDADGRSVGQPLTGGTDQVRAVAVGRLGDRDVIVAGTYGRYLGDVLAWDADGRPIGQPPRRGRVHGKVDVVLTSHSGTVGAVAVGQLGGRDVIISGDADGTVKVSDVDGRPVGRPLSGFTAQMTAVAMGRFGDRDVIVFGVRRDGTVRVRDAEGRPVSQSLPGGADQV